MCLSLWGYAWLEYSWVLFAILFFLPDASIAAYLRSTRFGTHTYNLAHTYLAPGVLALFGLYGGPVAYAAAIVWTAHIAFDRLFGYGLKYASGFRDTHLGRIGSGAAAQMPR